MKSLLICITMLPMYISAQQLADSVYAVELNLTASPLYSIFREERYPGGDNTSAFGYAFSLRGMWHPGRMLSIGLMIGYASVSEDEIPELSGNKVSAHLSAIPLQGVISMQRKGFEAGIGMGPYLMISSIGNNDLSIGRRLELGLTFFLAYTIDLNNIFCIGPEVRVLYLSYRGIISVMPSLTIRLNALRY